MKQLLASLLLRLEQLQQWFSTERSVLVAFSSGVDSTLLAKVAYMTLGRRAIAVTADSSALPREELNAAKTLARQIGIELVIVTTNELQNPNYVKNLPNRCYYCKIELFSKLGPLAELRGINTIIDGTNSDDLKEHRPGAATGFNYGIKSPLAELGFGKDEVRAISRYLGLPTADKPSGACLSSRFAYGMEITMDGLFRIERAEKFIKDLTGVKQIRVRNHGEIARIEVGKDERKLLFSEELLDKIDSELKALGFKYVSIEVGGYSTGSMNRFLTS